MTALFNFVNLSKYEYLYDLFSRNGLIDLISCLWKITIYGIMLKMFLFLFVIEGFMDT